MPAKEAIVQLRMDSDMKEKVETLYRQMGTSFAEAIRMFAAQSLLENRMPFHPTASAQLTKSSVSQKGKLARYADPILRAKEEDAFACAMEEKYGKAD